MEISSRCVVEESELSLQPVSRTNTGHLSPIFHLVLGRRGRSFLMVADTTMQVRLRPVSADITGYLEHGRRTSSDSEGTVHVYHLRRWKLLNLRGMQIGHYMHRAARGREQFALLPVRLCSIADVDSTPAN